MATARIVRSGKDRFVVLPEEIRVRGDTVEIYRQGDETILHEVSRGRAFRELINKRRREPGHGESHATLMAETKREIAVNRSRRGRERTAK